MKRISQSQAGFSLIELAIALVIIGLVIGGVPFLRGVTLLKAHVSKMFFPRLMRFVLPLRLFRIVINPCPEIMMKPLCRSRMD